MKNNEEFKYFKKRFSDGIFYYKVPVDYSYFWVRIPKDSWQAPMSGWRCIKRSWNEASTKICTEITEHQLFVELL